MEEVSTSARLARALSRRRFLAKATAGAGALAFGSAFGPAVSAWADDGASGSAPEGNAAGNGNAGLAESRGVVGPYATPSVTTLDEKAASPKRILIVVDYQVDFVDGGVFGTIEPARAIEDALCDKVREYQENDDIIIYTMDTHPADDYANTREATVNPSHCDPATEGWQLYGKLRDLINPDNAILVKKGTYGSRDLPFVIQGIVDQGIAVKSIEFAGVSTTCRVLHNAIIVYNFFPEAVLIFDAHTTAGYTDERTTQQLDELETWGFIVKR